MTRQFDKYIFHEARRYERKSIFAEVESFYNTLPSSERWRYQISLTKEPKIGINPKSSYNTPNGIYCYPIEFYVSEKAMMPYPSESEYKYVNLIKYTGDKSRYLELRNTKRISEDIHHKNMLLAYEQEDYINTTSRYKLPELFDMAEEKSEGDDKLKNLYLFWLLSGYYEENPNRWNYSLRTIGYDMVSDYGTSTIHIHEPTQTVILNMRAVKVIDRWDKKLFRITPKKQRENALTTFDLHDTKVTIFSWIDRETIKEIDNNKTEILMVKRFSNKQPFDIWEQYGERLRRHGIIGVIDHHSIFNDLPKDKVRRVSKTSWDIDGDMISLEIPATSTILHDDVKFKAQLVHRLELRDNRFRLSWKIITPDLVKLGADKHILSSVGYNRIRKTDRWQIPLADGEINIFSSEIPTSNRIQIRYQNYFNYIIDRMIGARQKYDRGLNGSISVNI